MSCTKLISNAITVILVSLLLTSVSFAQSALTDDAYVKSTPNTQDNNFGANPNLSVSSTGNTYVKFKVGATLPANTPGAQVAKATLKLYIANVNTPGKIDVYFVSAPWDESTITAANAPALGTLVATSSMIDSDKKGKFMVIDVTQAVQQWLGDDGTGTNGLPNYGLSLAPHPIDANTPTLLSVTVDSKENSQTSHESQLNVQLQSGGSGLTEVARDQTLSGNGAPNDPLGVADSGVGTLQLADNAVTANKIAPGSVVTSLNTLKDDVTLLAGSNITVTPLANTLTIAATGFLGNVAHDASLSGNGTSGSPLAVAPLGINTAHLANGSVTTDKIADGAVTGPKLAVPLSLTANNSSFTLSVANTGTGAAITAAGPINTNLQYNLGGNRLVSAPGLNTFVGLQTGQALTTGNQNSFFGNGAGLSNTEGNNNSFFGYHAGATTTTGSLNSFFGWGAGQANTTGSGNSFFGQTAGVKNTSGFNNAFFGISSGFENTTGIANAFFGPTSGAYNSDGGFNSFFGSSAGFSNTSGSANAFVGNGAGYLNTTGGSNTFIGAGAGNSNTTEVGNTFIGSSSNGAPGINNATAVGVAAVVTQSNSLVLGANGVNVGIGISAPKARLHVNGGNILVEAGQGIILKSPNGSTCRLMTIDNAGAMVLTAIGCP